VNSRAPLYFTALRKASWAIGKESNARLLSLRSSATNADFPFGLENGKTIRLSRRLPTFGGVERIGPKIS
jgi:hypothetical protein